MTIIGERHLDVADDRQTVKFNSLLSATNYVEYVARTTHTGSRRLHPHDMCVPLVDVRPLDDLSDHSSIVFTLNVCVHRH